MSRVRVLYFGMPVEFSAATLRRLRDAAVEVCGVVVPRPTRPASISPDAFILHPSSFIPHPSAFSLAASGLPLYEAASLKAADTLSALAAFKPDVICVACFPHIFPRALLNLPPLGCLNLHPSLLPRYRGPAPLFWQFQQGEAETGVTVHFMDEGADTGDIALQRPVLFPDGCTGQQADRLCGEAGGELLGETLRLLAEGRCPRLPQTPGRDDPMGRLPAGDVPTERLYWPWPAPADFELSPAWPARRAFNFVRGTAHWGLPYGITLEDRRLEFRRAVSYTPGERLGAAWRERGGEVAVQFADGVVGFEGQMHFVDKSPQSI